MGPELWAITGGSGFIGSALAARLATRGVATRLLMRSAATGTTIRGDIRDPAAVRALVKGASIVVHLAAFVHRRVRDEDDERECWSINVDGTQTLVDAVAESASDAFVVFMSSANVYGPSEEPLTETMTPSPETLYGTSKLEAEHRAVGAIRDGSITGCVLRPAMVFGPGAPGNLARLIRMVRSRVVVEIGGGSQKKSLVDIETLLDAIEEVVRRRDVTSGRVFNVGGTSMSIHDINRTIADALGVRPLVLSLPEKIIRLVPSRFRRLLETYSRSSILDDSLLRETVGVEPHPSREALTALLLREQRPTAARNAKSPQL